MVGKRLDADFTEDVVGFAIDSFLTLVSFPFQRFTVVPFSRSKERWLGADARIAGSNLGGFRPFYMQFKRPSAYPDHSSAGIVSERKRLKLSVYPRSLYFPLRDKQPHHRSYQHNILFNLHRRLTTRGLGSAAYVCPFFLDRSAYRHHVHLAGLSRWLRFWRVDPWDLDHLRIRHGDSDISFRDVPVLAEHVAIPPHCSVTNAKHSYSFNEAGLDLCFHSPEALPEGASSLTTFLKGIARDLDRDGGKITLDRALETLAYLTNVEGDLPFYRELKLSADDPIGSWFAWGDILRREYGIEQYAFIDWGR